MMIYTTSREGRCTADLESIFYQQKRSIFLTGEISDKVSTDIIQQMLYLAEISKDPINLYINSPGGSVTAGFAIYDIMRSCGCEVATICNGSAASMGAFLLASGTPGRRYCSPYAEVMIHQVMGGTQGQAADIEICADHIRYVKNTINKLLADMTGQDVERIRADTERDYFMTAQQALEYGMVDHIGCAPTLFISGTKIC